MKMGTMQDGSARRPSALVDREGEVKARRVGTRRAWSRDAYHFLSTTSWTWLITLLTVLFVLANALFGLLYWLRPGCVANTDGSFVECFFFQRSNYSDDRIWGVVPGRRLRQYDCGGRSVFWTSLHGRVYGNHVCKILPADGACPVQQELALA